MREASFSTKILNKIVNIVVGLFIVNPGDKVLTLFLNMTWRIKESLSWTLKEKTSIQPIFVGVHMNSYFDIAKQFQLQDWLTETGKSQWIYVQLE